MKRLTKITIIGCLLFFTTQVNATQNYLKKCWTKQVKPLQDQYLNISFREKSNVLEHRFYPWQETNYIGKGEIWSNNDSFLKSDTLINGSRTFFSKMSFNKSELLFLDFGDKDLYPVTKDMFLDQTFKAARYLPTNLINYFFKKNISFSKESNQEFAVYKTVINKTIVKLYINKTNNLLEKITTLNDDDLFGDVLNTIIYTDYATIGQLYYSKDIKIEKINGRIKDEVTLFNERLTKETPQLLNKPANYILLETKEAKQDIKTVKYNKNIYLLELKHTDDRVLVVEFSDFLLVAEAPLNSKNGELIIAETKKIAPNKPIKYFVFGHYHPHYLGGIRPFVHKGAKILCSTVNKEYVRYLSEARHTINPDSLELQPKTLQIEEVKDSLAITDSKNNAFRMIIYFIGKKSEHTNDYLIYYFPNEKLLFEDDLVWIKRDGQIAKANQRQTGLYNTTKELNLDIKTIIQSWPVSDYGVKTIIPFEDLKKSIDKKQ